tara:strand:+ start:657 stop:1517 length:861 start_codon:yes stop_codon:yes gene_type:complete
MIPAPNCFGNCPDTGGIYVNSLLAGGACPPTHPNSQRPHCPPPGTGGPTPPPPPGTGGPTPPPILTNCQTCNSGQWQTQMMELGSSGQCPAGWEPVDGTNPCNVLGEPGISNSFVQNIQNGYERETGCNFLYSKLAVQEQKLAQLQAAGTNPAWQQMLNNRIIYIEGMIAEVCTMTATNGPNGTTFNTGNTSTGNISTGTPAQPYIPAQAAIPFQPAIPAQPGIPYYPAYGNNPGQAAQAYIPAQPEIPAQPAIPAQAYIPAQAAGTMMSFNGRTQSLEDFYDEIV